MSNYPLSPELSAFVDKTLGFGYPDSSIQGLRIGYSEMCKAFTPPRPADIAVSEQRIAGVPVRQYRPTSPRPADGWPCVVYLHGGGWVVGDLDSHDFITAELASLLKAVVVAVDYRLAPEQPFPAAFDDCLAVWRSLRNDAEDWQLDRNRLAIAGDSAGGNLAAAVCLALRDAGEPQPLVQALIYPGLGGDDGLPSRSECADAPLLSASDVHCYHTLYLPGPGKPSAYAMPLQATDFHGLAPAFIAVAQYDPLRDDGVCYFERLKQAGGTASLHLGLGLVHGCLRARGMAQEVDLLYEKLLAQLRRYLSL
ncbi:alpha/beta hydrolase [Pseudomonas gingeri NCPPB 3146 = LMG 5327]|uniref:Alpha/beta hydrolase n=4 Tax=Pseudomonas gingeri TaxID=117681 RepID=A0A7Y7XWQ5_9PSED|nr:MULTISPECIES: alpha/beta hydrolase [Pseudomonas]NVZ24181.1 alpha/beta hydrolase [Pseudomonas gingeri]NWC13742.1 alpha/beta hydrolase [Pseudomonas gingeri]NWE45050.1 alpha/beta hydrolase [Pseudomonas gingeri]PNQ92531.1 alpha/beta hydrolase [Pseudomonas gingeri NCPPB 3146 = LMG 5327]BBP76889.1 lipolytic protein [Pseudomonas sp. Ost2]